MKTMCSIVVATLPEVMDHPAMLLLVWKKVSVRVYINLKQWKVKRGKGHVHLLGFGALMRHVREAVQILAN